MVASVVAELREQGRLEVNVLRRYDGLFRHLGV
jgi:hypothetical protein